MDKQSSEITIRDARPEDEPAIRAVTLAAYEEYGQKMGPLFWERYRQLLVETLADEGTAERIVAVLAGKIVGSVLLYPPMESAYGTGRDVGVAGPEVRLLAVDPAARGLGIGGALMRECVRRARGAGATALGLHTMDVMQTAMQMYERMGFVRTPELDFHPTENVIVKGYRLDF